MSAIDQARIAATHLQDAQREMDDAIQHILNAQRLALTAMAHETDPFAWQAWGQALGAIQLARKTVEAMEITKRATGTGRKGAA